MTTSPRTVEGGGNALVNLARRWDRFWFRPADPMLLGAIRVLCGLVVLWVHLAFTGDLQETFGTHAWVDHQTLSEFRYNFTWFDQPTTWDEETTERAPYARGYYAWSVWYHITDPHLMKVVHWGILVVMVLFTVGFCTRVTSVLTWIGAISYTQRAPTSLFGMDTMMNLLLIYLMIGPSGAAFSVDRLIARYWSTWRALRAHRPAPLSLKPAPLVSAGLALRLLQVNLCIIYLGAGFSKLQGSTWWNGTAIHNTLANPEFSPMHTTPFGPLLFFLCRHCWLWQLSMNAMVAFTFFVEIGFPFLVWNPRMRWTMITAATMMHIGIALSMGLTGFSMFMILMVFAFIPQETVDRLWLSLGKNLEQLRLAFNGRARGQVRAASLVRACDAWDQVDLAEAGSAQRSVPARSAGPERLQLVAPKGGVLTGYPLFVRLVRSLPLLWPLALWTFVPGAARIGLHFFPGTGQEAAAPPVAEAERRAVREEQVTR